MPSHILARGATGDGTFSHPPSGVFCGRGRRRRGARLDRRHAERVAELAVDWLLADAAAAADAAQLPPYQADREVLLRLAMGLLEADIAAGQGGAQHAQQAADDDDETWRAAAMEEGLLDCDDAALSSQPEWVQQRVRRWREEQQQEEEWLADQVRQRQMQVLEMGDLLVQHLQAAADAVDAAMRATREAPLLTLPAATGAYYYYYYNYYDLQRCLAPALRQLIREPLVTPPGRGRALRRAARLLVAWQEVEGEASARSEQLLQAVRGAVLRAMQMFDVLRLNFAFSACAFAVSEFV